MRALLNFLQIYNDSKKITVRQENYREDRIIINVSHTQLRPTVR